MPCPAKKPASGRPRATPTSTNEQDLTSQRNGLVALGVPEDRIYAGHGLTGTDRTRPTPLQATQTQQEPEAHAIALYNEDQHTTTEIADLTAQSGPSPVPDPQSD